MSNIVEDVQKLDPASELIHLFEIEVSKGVFAYFSGSGVESNLGSLKFRDYDSPGTIRTYAPIPIEAQNFETKNDGAMARPNVTIANVTNVLSTATGSVNYHSLLGLKLIRRTTLKKYLDDGTGNSANPPVEFARQVWIIDRIKARSKTAIQMELVSPFDIETVQIPARKVYADRCSHKYQGASPHLDRWKKAQSGCPWAIDGSYFVNGTSHVIFVNQDNEYVIPSSTTFTLYSSGSIVKNAYYKTTKTTTRFNADGTSSSVTINNYWQAVFGSNSPGTPTDSNTNFKRVRIYSTYSASTEYYTYLDDRDNDYVVYTDAVSSSENYNKSLLWKAEQANEGQTPTYGEFWEKGDACSKTTAACKMRFGWIKNGSTNNGSVTTDTRVVLPFGGFPAARTFR